MELSYLEPDDIEEYLELFDITLTKNQLKTWWDIYDNSDTRVIYAAKIFNNKLHKECIVGSVSIIVDTPVNSSPIIYLVELFVAEKYRHLGIGTLIIESVLEEAKTYKPYKILIAVDDKYIDYYTKQGFQKTQSLLEYNDSSL